MRVQTARRSAWGRCAAVPLAALGILMSWPGLPERFLGADGFMPHGHCYLWDPWLIRVHVFGDVSIGLAYVAISLTLVYLVYRARQEIPFSWMFLAFGLFIISCGGTHFMEVWTLWRPDYWAAGGLKLVTALASVGTAVLLPTLIAPTLTMIENARLARLEAPQMLLAAIVQASDDAIYSTSLDDAVTITSWNKGASKIYGYEAEEILGQSVALLHPPERRDELPPLRDRLRGGGSVDHYETVRRTKDGLLIDVSMTISPIKDAHGRVVGSATVARDISERKKAEEQLRLVVEAAPNAMILVGMDGRIVLANAQTETLFGYPRQELLGQTVELLVPGRYRGGHPGHRAEFFKSPEARPMGAGRDLFGRRWDGTEVPIEIGLNPIETSDGLFTLASIVDITQRKKLQEQREVETRNRELEMLLHVTSHDLREPLRSIETFSQVVHDENSGRLDENGRDLLQRIVRASARMRRLIDDISLLSQARKRSLSYGEVDCGAVVKDILARLEEKIKSTGARVEVAGQLPRLTADRVWVTQALYNLISNALKFPSSGRAPDVEIGPHRSDGDGAGIAVRDRGPGVAAKDAERVFGLFQRAVGREIEGTGAGLAIVRAVAERHGGRAWVQPREGEGSEFIITFGPSRSSRETS